MLTILLIIYRHHVKQSTGGREQKIAEKYTHYVVTSLTPKATAVEEVAAETVKEATLMAVITVMITNE